MPASHPLSSKSGPPAGSEADPRRLLGQRIKELRAAQGLTQEEAADRIGVFRTYMSRMESGQANPTLTMLHQIASALGVDVVQLLRAATAGSPRRVKPDPSRPSRGRVGR